MFKLGRDINFYGIGFFLLLVLIWWGTGRWGMLERSIFPTIGDVFKAAVSMIKTGSIIQASAVSIGRIVMGFVLAAFLGLAAGLASGISKPLQSMLRPFLHLLRQIPPVAWIPFFILWFGIGESSKTTVIAYASFFSIWLSVESGISHVDDKYLELGKALKLSKKEVIAYIIIPHAAPEILTGLRTGLGLGWRALVAAELLAASSGLGYLINSSRYMVRPDDMMVGVIVVGILGITTDSLLSKLIAIITPWSVAVGKDERYAV